ncbi:hypothetical protein [Brevundimonas sp.]|uniref:hypothetical protein n=1 Tax=Brevundimonas sp. TaxID=1871086 RepID=UPI003F6EBE06
MTEPHTGQTFADDIEADADSTSARLDREADAILLEDERHARPLRRAVREDAGLVRDWGQERVARLRGTVEAEPLKATLYALALGVVIGMLAAR